MSGHAATAEHTLVSGPELRPAPTWTPLSAPTALREPRATALGAGAIAGLLCLATFLGGGGLELARMTTLELILTLCSGAIVAVAAMLAPPGARRYGAWAIALLLAFTALTGLSVAWSVAPDASWQDAGRLIAYSGVLAAAVTLAWILPAGWRALLGGVLLAATVVCAYALLTKVLPDRLDANDPYARLQQPYGYWNAIGLTAAMGAIGFLWLGARRAGHALLTALAYPGIGLMLVTVMLAYSRGALVALAIGAVVWLALVPLRLRGVRVLAVGALAAGPVVAWDFAKRALKDEAVALAARTTAGHQFGVLLAAMLVVLALAGAAIGFFGDRRAPRAATRRAVGIAIGALVALGVLGAVAGLAASKRGLTGTVSHELSLLTDPNAKVPNTSARLTAVSSVRARYWKEAIEIFEAHPVLGAGAAGYEVARLRYRTVPIDVRQAHGYLVQTLADLGVAGLALTLALLLVWMAVAGRSTHPFNRRWRAARSRPWLSWRRLPGAYTSERVGLLTMVCIVVTFGVHSFVDWTWYVPGNALVALLCAGWLAGRGPLPAGNPAAPAGSSAAAHAVANSEDSPGGDAGVPVSNGSFSAAKALGQQSSTSTVAQVGAAPDHRTPGHVQPAAATPARVQHTDASPSRLRPAGLTSGRVTPGRIAVAIAIVVAALLGAWSEWQPQRSVDASEQALALLRRRPVAALSAAQAGVDRDPLSATALFRLAAVQSATGQAALARTTLQRAVKLQPSNPETWVELGRYDLHHDPSAAVQELRAAVYLDPLSIATQNAYVLALRGAPAAATAVAAEEARAAALTRARPSHAPAQASHARVATPHTAGQAGGGGAQKRLRRALPSSVGRAPGTPPAPTTSTSSKPKSTSRSTSARRV